jgi:hypothetical protein
MFLVLVVGCGPKAQTGSGGGTTSSGDSQALVPEETMDGIRSVFERKTPLVGRCYADAISAGEVKNGDRGYITVGTTIEPDGKARGTSVLETDLNSKVLHSCVTTRVESWDFPKPPVLYQTSHTYYFQEY